MNSIDSLNPQQQEAVTAGTGPILVLAGPGSGKTRVLTQRIAYLIGQQGVRAYQILAVTFTNKAAREMKERVENLIGPQFSQGLMLGTFHSVCARILRREVEHLPFDNNFVIFNADDQINVVKSALRELNIDEKRYRPRSVHGSISNAKNELIRADQYPSTTYRDEVVKQVYARYQELLLENNALDFDDLLMMTARLLEEEPAIREKYSERFQHILVDEFQDTNIAQYTLLKHLASFHHNIFVVGDPDQCFPPETSILTSKGNKSIADLKIGDQVIAASGRGSTLPSRIGHIGKRYFEGELVSVKTQKGYSFRATPNHIIFARLGLSANLNYVYLMYRKDKGYRVGVASHSRSDGLSIKIGLQVRSNQEKADKIWVLKVCEDRAEAHYWEAFYAFSYGIPTTVFHTSGRKMRFTQEKVNHLFEEIDTRSNAQRLMGDLEIDEKYPHYLPQGTYRNLINIRYFGDGRKTKQSPWHAHRVDLWSSEEGLAKKLQEQGYNPRIRSRNNWRIGFNRLKYNDIHAVAEELSKNVGNTEILVGAFLVDKGDAPLSPRFNLMPTSQLHPSMIVAVEKDGKIVEDIIVEISREPYIGDVYDIEVDNLHNYLASGIVVHNSIYRWRGADYRNVHRFEQDNPNTKTILLEQNYRSKQNILDAAMAVIDRNPQRTRKQLFTERGEGHKLSYFEAADDYAEATFIVDTILQITNNGAVQPSDCAIMYRTNAQSRLLEEAFLRAQMPYRLVGAQRFYGRREVRDVIAYLRLIHNPSDQVSLARVISTPPRGIGKKTLTDLHQVARAAGSSPGAVLLDLSRGKKSPYWDSFSARAASPLSNFGNLFAEWRASSDILTISELFDKVIADIRYQDHLDDGTDEGIDRWENVLELRRLAEEYDQRTMTEFLENVALISDQDTLTEGQNAATMLTLHAAKGLEFGVVFIVGLDDGLLPHNRSFDEPEEMAEERRLFYVGITRAKDHLYLVRSVQRGGRGYAEATYPSRFLDDIPEDLMLGKSRAGRVSRSASRSQARWSTPSLSSFSGRSTEQPAPVMEAKYKMGSRVRHPTWDEGIVLSSKLEDGDETVTIVFESVGIKRLAASLAKLEILS
ncbi:MAG: UvrD-helicase domain-containing protein [Anaerolineales bacterium]|uniref:DNA 3'-5' helicase n=1 Tax=Candidatus Desulfolinea nitratireducens TaxID=2841698 RepID=A0A8J6NLJ2_9CHLR|nr:UvrD-helicase domain-containing protein [Candidatus Desulfolinea nitratireducens]MBL6960341.1 UvrD-helicase domain-containing protein [Anaerolineales bacterium]